ncbi:hypothetical protein [Dyadobacter sp. NIV53]|uniref:hypothetical protein n=1 Tax=Dyadobacter sp. NIV53 TaxID=2861765 RepID=UPI001C879B28|nr:hypothetical protein [Dyadobacter sp. NIV53]
MENFTLVLTSSVLAATLTSLVNWLLQRNNYRNDYYKKVIEKRMSVYDEVSKVMGRLQIINVSPSNKKSHAVFLDHNQYEDFAIMLAKASLEGIWLSNNCSKLLTTLNEFLYNTFRDIPEISDNKRLDSMNIAEKNFSEISRQRELIRDQILKDLLIMYEVKSFLKTKN